MVIIFLMTSIVLSHLWNANAERFGVLLTNNTVGFKQKCMPKNNNAKSKKQTTKGAFGNKNAKKLTLKTKLGALFFKDLKLNRAVATPLPPNGIDNMEPFEMGEYLEQLKRNPLTPKSIDKILTFDYIKDDSSEIGAYEHTLYTYTDANYDVMFIELVKLNKN